MVVLQELSRISTTGKKPKASLMAASPSSQSQSKSLGLTFSLPPNMVIARRNEPKDEIEKPDADDDPVPADKCSVEADSRAEVEEAAESQTQADIADEPSSKNEFELPAATTKDEKAAPEEFAQGLDEQRLEGDDTDLPVVSIHLERLIGYPPTEEGELDQIKEQLLEGMWQKHNEDAQSATDTNPAHAPPDFDEQVTELYESGVANFYPSREDATYFSGGGDLAKNEKVWTHLILPYPPRLQIPMKNRDPQDGIRPRPHLVPTKQIWTDLQRRRVRQNDAVGQSARPVIHRLLQHLEHCNHGILWKSSMSLELCQMIQSEQANVEYQNWVNVGRQKKLEQLYEVRETLVHQAEMAEQKVKDLKKERELMVTEMLIQQRREQGEVDGAGGLQAFDMESTRLAFPEKFKLLKGLAPKHKLPLEYDGNDDEDSDPWDFLNGNEPDPSDGEDAFSESSSSYEDSGDEDDYFGESEDSGYEGNEEVPAPDKVEEEEFKENNLDDVEPNAKQSDAPSAELTDIPSPALVADTFARRRKFAKQRRKQKRAAAKEAEHQAKLDAARVQQEKAVAKCTTPALVHAQTFHSALKDKMLKVEELLETLQDEAWAAEEELEEQRAMERLRQVAHDISPEDALSKEAATSKVSLLDQILAMILGALPRKPGASQEEHFRFVRQEHAWIVAEWKEYFGRLPPPAGEETKVQMPRLVKKPEAIEEPEPPKPTPGPRKVGLRPGGRAKK